MSNIAQAFALVTIGGLVGFGGFALMSQHSAPADAATAPAVQATPVVRPATDPVEPAAPAPQSEAVAIAIATTGSVESDAPDLAYAVLRVTASADVAELVLNVSGTSGAVPQEAIGAQALSANGSSLRVDLGELHAHEEREVVVAFQLRGQRGGFTATTSYLDLHSGEPVSVVGTRDPHTLDRTMRDGATYEIVRLAYSELALRTARELRDDSQFAAAKEWVEHAYAANVEVGMTLRITGELNGAQGELSRMRDELEVLMKPKKKVVRKAAPKPTIEFVRGDS